MASRAVAGMTFQPIARKTQRHAADQGIARFFGQNTGCRNRGFFAVSSDNGALFTGPEAQGENTIDKHQIWSFRKALKGPQHRQLRGHTDSLGIHLPR